MSKPSKNSLPDDYATVTRAVPHRDTILRLTLDMYAKTHGSAEPVDIDLLNALLAASDQPLTDATEIRAWYGETVWPRRRN